jgi:predicted outer membrane repeat protein
MKAGSDLNLENEGFFMRWFSRAKNSSEVNPSRNRKQLGLQSRRHALRLEPLEDRRMLTIFAVGSLADVVADDGVVTLREAIEAANTNVAVFDAAAGSATEVDQITFDADLYSGGPATITLGGSSLQITDDLDIIGPGSENLTIDANEQSSIFQVVGSGDEVTLSGMTLTNGFSDQGGGAIWNEGILSVSEMTFSGNQAIYRASSASSTLSATLDNPIVASQSDTVEMTAQEDPLLLGCQTEGYVGGAVWNGGTMTVTDSIFSNNNASSLGGAIFSMGTLTITDSVLSNNSANEGGGIYNHPSGTATLDNVTVSGNTADYGGGIKNFGVVEIADSVISENEAEYGGGLYCYPDSTATVSDVVFESNVATQAGGAIYSYRSTLNIMESTFEQNESEKSGGAISSIYGFTTEVVDSTFTGNYASKYGGAIYSSASLIVDGSIFSANQSGSNGGAIYSDQSLTVDGSILKNNQAGSSGGGLYSLNKSVTITDCDIIGNVGSKGGGVYLHKGASISDSVIAENKSVNDGGGLYVHFGELNLDRSVVRDNFSLNGSGGGLRNVAGAAHVVNSTICGNEAGVDGGGVANTEVLTLLNTTVMDNSAGGSGGGLWGGQSNAEVINTVIADNIATTDSDLSGPLDGESKNNFIGTIDGDPLLTGFADAGGDVQFYLPKSGSPLIDAGDMIAPTSFMLRTDQLGNLRYNGTVDIGSTELQMLPELAVSVSPDILIPEGDSINVDVYLTSMPLWSTDVTIETVEGNSANISLDGSTAMQFNGNNWNISQSFSIGSVKDIDDINEMATFAISSPGMQTFYLKVTVVDQLSGEYIVNSLGLDIAEDGLLTLPEAIAAANTNSQVGDAMAGSSVGADRISFDPALFDSGPAEIVLDGSALEISDDTIIEGPGADLLMIDADGKSWVIDVSMIATVEIQGVTISGGYGDRGGGIHSNGTLTLTEVAFTDNDAQLYGAAIYTEGPLSISDSTFVNNYTDGNGGAINNHKADILIEGCLFSNNEAVNEGGAVHNYAGDVTIHSSVFTGNNSGDGGGAVTNLSGATMEIANSIFSGNSTIANGGAIYNFLNSNLSIYNSTVSGNWASGDGGGVHSQSGSTLLLANTIVSLNESNNVDNFSGSLAPARGGNLIGGDPDFLRNPYLGGDGVWGTPDDDYGDLRLGFNSDAINIGDASLLPVDIFDLDGDGDMTEQLPIDLIGNPRVEGVGLEAGAYEKISTCDFNGDGFVGAADLAMLTGHWGEEGTVADLNGDGVVGTADLAMLTGNWGEATISVVGPIDNMAILPGQEQPEPIDLGTVFDSIGPITFSATSSNPELVMVEVIDGQLHLTLLPSSPSQDITPALISVTATVLTHDGPLSVNDQFAVALVSPPIVTKAIRGDANGDGMVTTADLAAVDGHWQTSSTEGAMGGDFNGDGFVSTADLAVVTGNWQKTIWDLSLSVSGLNGIVLVEGESQPDLIDLDTVFDSDQILVYSVESSNPELVAVELINGHYLQVSYLPETPGQDRTPAKVSVSISCEALPGISATSQFDVVVVQLSSSSTASSEPMTGASLLDGQMLTALAIDQQQSDDADEDEEDLADLALEILYGDF